MSEPDRLQLHRDRSVLLVVDIQARLCPAMNPERLARMKRNSVTLIEAAKVLALPIYVSEQFPRGLGATIPEIDAALPEDTARWEKLHFSCCEVEELMTALAEGERDQVILCGMETHVCVFQTARDLARAGYAVFAPEDAVISRTQDNHAIGMSLMAEAGATCTGTETVLFDLLHVAGTPEFKAIAPLIK